MLGAHGLDPAAPHPEPGVPAGVEIVGTPNIAALTKKACTPDTRVENVSSIAVLCSYDGRTFLLPGDASPDKLCASIRRLVPEGGKLRLDAMVVPHHGSKGNVSRELLEAVECRRFLFSSDGATHGHPTPEAVARVIRYGGPRAELFFNYRTAVNGVWDDEDLTKDETWGYGVHYPEGAAGIEVVLPPG